MFNPLARLLAGPLATLLTACILCTGVLCQPPKKGEVQAGESSTSKEESTLKTWSDKEAKAALAEFKKVANDKKASLKQKTDALEKLREGRNALLVKPLGKVVKKDKHVSVRKLAAELIGNQPPKAARKELLSLLRDKKVLINPAVLAQSVRSFSKSGYESKDWKALEKIYHRFWVNRSYADALKAVFEAAGKHKELASLKILVPNVQAPEPAWVDDPSNPPAEWWERRVKNWQVYRGDVKEALFQITGQRFSKNKEARDWLKKNGNKLRKKTKSGKKKKKR